MQRLEESPPQDVPLDVDSTKEPTAFVDKPDADGGTINDLDGVDILNSIDVDGLINATVGDGRVEEGISPTSDLTAVIQKRTRSPTKVSRAKKRQCNSQSSSSLDEEEEESRTTIDDGVEDLGASPSLGRNSAANTPLDEPTHLLAGAMPELSAIARNHLPRGRYWHVIVMFFHFVLFY